MKRLLPLLVAGLVLTGLATTQNRVDAQSTTSPLRITLDVDGYRVTRTVAAETVGEALSRLEVTFHAQARIHPQLEANLKPGMIVAVDNPVQVSLTDGTETQTLDSFAPDIATLLQESAIALSPADQLSPEADTLLRQGLEIRIVRVEEREETETEAIAYPTERRDDDNRLVGTRETLQAGEDGEKEITYRRRFENGEQVSEEVIDETVLREPTPEIIAIGTRQPEPEPTHEPAAETSTLVPATSTTGTASWLNKPGYSSEYTAAHRTLPRGTRVRVTNPRNGKSVIVTIAGWGPERVDREIDLSLSAFSAIADPYFDGVIHNAVIEPL